MASATLDQDVIESLKHMKVNGNRLELPDQKEFTIPNYQKLKTAIQKAGGKYSKNGFAFSQGDPQEILDRLLGGEKIDDKKKFQDFETPEALADESAERLCLADGHQVLEPEAGGGRLVEAVRRRGKSVDITCYEINLDKITHLSDVADLVESGDFLQKTPEPRFDRVIMNPPFQHNQDVDHVLHALEFLKPDGRLVAHMSNTWRHGSQRKQVAFRDKLEELGAEIEDIDRGEFKESGTMVPTCRVIIQLRG